MLLVLLVVAGAVYLAVVHLEKVGQALGWMFRKATDRGKVIPLAAIGPHNPIGQTLERSRAWPPPVLDPSGLERIRVGVKADGTPWELGVLGAHILIAGVSGAGKSSVIWSLVEGIGPYVRCGLVEVWAIDPKGGMELTIGRDIFKQYKYMSWEDMAGLLEDAVVEMQKRQQRLAGKVRKHIPTVEEPLIVVLVDEMTVLTEIKDSKVRGRISGALFTLLAQGRAAGVTVIGAGQDIRKERLGDRHMFTTSIMLRMERLQVDMIRAGAWEAGAKCDAIPKDKPGTGFVLSEDGPPFQVRSYWLPDDDVRRIAALYGKAS